MAHDKTPKRLAEQATRVVGRLPDEKRAELAKVVDQVEDELASSIKKASPARVALAKLKLARLADAIGYDAVVDLRKRG